MTISKKIAAGVLFSCLSGVAAANWNVGAGITNFSESSDGFDISVNALTLNAGFEYREANSAFSFMPELRFGIGMGDDSVTQSFEGFVITGDVEIDYFTSLSVRGNYYLSDKVAVFIQPSYTSLKVTAKVEDYSESDTSSEFGIGAGINIQASDKLSFEVAYEVVDETDMLSGTVRYHF